MPVGLGEYLLSMRMEFSELGGVSGRSIVIPEPLTEGGEVALIAPARWMSEEDLAPAEHWIRSQGWVPVRSPNLLEVHHQWAGTDEQRASDLTWALERPSVRAIWCIRGGYGSARMVDLVDWSLLKRHPKWLVGYSDPTVLLAAAWSVGVAAVHGTMPVNVRKNAPSALETLARIWRSEGSMSGDAAEVEWTVSRDALQGAEEADGWRFGRARGPMVGGNLSVLYSLLGSNTFPDLRGCILFIEDLDEYRYHIDRMLLGLKRAGALEGVVGVVIGGMTDLHDNAVPFGRSPGSLVLEYFPEVPVASGFPMGHLDDNQAFVHGGVHDFSVDIKAVLRRG